MLIYYKLTKGIIMERSTLFYLKASIAGLVTLIVVLLLFLGIYDYSTSEIVEGRYVNEQFYHQESDNAIPADNYQQRTHSDGDSVKLLYNEVNDVIMYYGSFYEYFKRFVIGFVVIFAAWFFAFLGEKRKEE